VSPTIHPTVYLLRSRLSGRRSEESRAITTATLTAAR